ncbi:polyketide synthase [Fusarium pseudoanthophilum]|uniref:Polyketide synthase n=1 Tax=Fusarium pseudoanthophilum TaxID=48495 RepID=A0A8H5P6S5_9HYPO|nr:polyketide synthase [Fusarium pseudoanthophilum]
MPSPGEPIAVIGSACRFPGGASSPSKLWSLLHSPKDCLRDFPKDRLNLEAFYNKDGEHHGATDVCNKGYLLEEDSRLFDASFFNVNPAEADGMDPQQRLTLETVYESLEAAGYSIEEVQGSLTAVYLGVMTGDYHDIQSRDPEIINRYHPTGTSKSILSNRVSYYFDLRGPSVTMDTACSSSLAALHFAAQSLRSGESTTAIAVGVNLIFDAAGYVAESKLHMLSPTSRSRMWDAGADGYARGEGVASVILKPLSEAIRCGDHIECIVRETGMNSDGRTTGITMPSAAAQSALIRRTYQNAGLDPVKDRPQYFEAHGTGTLAGDPVEARAIRQSFFDDDVTLSEDAEKLYCGSIKTVIGHTEGCAGLAGLLKASLAVQNATIPPNLLFNTLNPSIKPFYDRLQVPTAAMPWPDVSRPRRVSLNSFGFGGTNVHAIVENYQPDEPCAATVSEKFVGPLVISAETESSLATTVGKYADFIRSNPDVNLEDVAFVTQTRRSVFSRRAFFSGENRDKLLEFLDSAVETSKTGAEIGIQAPGSSSEPPAILGIFTGQGAQWASMGKTMIETSSQFRESIQKCQDALLDIPDAPTWNLMDELMAPEEASRIGEAAISQPLCTATQIAIVDVLASAGVHFDAVVGHSSGEISAVYAAGLLSATDAMRIAYYRGLYAKHASGPSGAKGSMMAVGMGSEDATAFCDQEQFKGRISLAASNSPSSATISGDEDAILEAKEILDEQKTFARLLKVDTAYHSHHMRACAEPYLVSLKACNITVNSPSSNCIWVSSVYGNADMLDDEDDLSALSGQYWIDNMVRPVLFSEALECSLWRAGPFNLSLEIGPHPALKGPASQTMKTALGHVLPYATFLRRGYDDVEAFSGGIGYVWAYLGPHVDFAGYYKAIHGPGADKPKMIKGLPSYTWNHNKIHWKESRLSRRYRLAEKAPHELLGRRTPDYSEFEIRWRNILRLNELPWIRGHAFQGMALFPTSGYMAMAIQAAMEIAGSRPVKFVEIRDLVIPRALTIEENNPGIESIFSVKKTGGHVDEDAFYGEFSCHTCSAEAEGTLERNCTGLITIDFGEPSDYDLPPRAPGKSGITPVDTQEYYDSLLNIGLNYQGLFRGLKSVQRTMGYATTKATWDRSEVGDQYVMHPGPLDVAFHSIIAAMCTPLSGALWAPYLPVKIDRLAIAPSTNYEGVPGEINFDVDTFITETTSNTFRGDMHIISPDGKTGLQAEGLTLKLFTEASSSDDRHMFSKTIWRADVLDSSDNLDEINPDEQELALAEAIDRTSFYFIRKTFDHLSDKDAEDWKWFHKAFYKAAKEVLQETRDGKHPTAEKEWFDDTEELIQEYKDKYPGQADLKLIHAVAENLVGVMASDTQLLEVMLVDNMLSNLYTDGRAMQPLNRIVAELFQNLSHRYPRLNILEIGAGTGGTTNSVLNAIGDTYGRYTYTDISAGFFEAAKTRFHTHSKRLDYKVLDIENDPTGQGIPEGSQDVVLAANVLHATRNLNETMTNVRKLLKPGGYLIMVEVTGYYLQMMFLMGGLPGWWLGLDEGRTRGPGIGLTDWDEILRDSGFTGADKYVTDLPDSLKHVCSVLVSQAADERVTMLQEPLSFLDEIPLEQRLLIISGKTLPISRVVKSIQRLTSRVADQVTVVDTIDSLSDKHLGSETSVICLTELEKPIFSTPMTSPRLSNLQSLFSHSSQVLWLTAGRLDESPYANMTIGLGRAIINELPQLNLQFLDLPKASSVDAKMVVEAFLKLKLAKSAEFTKTPMLWSTEPEVLLRDGLVMIPRVVPDKERNNRLNSQRRKITKDVSLGDTEVVLTNTEGGLCLEEKAPWAKSLTGNGMANIQVEQSLSLPFCEGEVLCIGKSDGQVTMAIVPHHSSKVSLPKTDVFTVPEAETTQAQADLLVHIAVNLTASLILSTISSAVPTTGDDNVLIYGASTDIQSALTVQASRKPIFASSEVQSDSSFIHIHPRASIRTIQHLLPRGISHFVDLSEKADNKITQHLSHLYETISFKPSHALASNTARLLETVHHFSCRSQLSSPPTTVSIQEITSLSAAVDLTRTIIDWTTPNPVSVTIRPISGQGLFSTDKTYLMVGLVSDFGRSLCRWMVENGAKYIVLTSRRAQVDQLWLQEMEDLGAVVRVYPMDVSKRDSVQAVCDSIKDLPPVGGVCNGALVLKDQLFVKMEPEALSDVFAPKVDGTIHLSEIFSEPTLDFFVLFSSMSSVVGNAGQSNYNAASLFQAAIAQQRRERGLAASVMALGMVADVGYIAAKGPTLMERLKKAFYMPISESDAHQIFAEAVAASKPGVTDDDTIEMVSGIQPFNYTASTKARPPWVNNPRFSHFVREEEGSKDVDAGRAGQSNIRILERLDAAGSEEEAAVALLVAFRAKVETMLQMTPDSLNVEASLLDVGIDSLLAVEIRSWFLKEVHVDVPVLKTLSGDNARDICADAANKYLSAKMQESKSDTGDASKSDSAANGSATGTSSDGSSSPVRSGHATPPSTVGETEHQEEVKQEKELERVEKLSYAQARLWFLSQFSKDDTSYNCVYVYCVTGNIQIPRLKRAVSTVTNHHDSLRTCFFTRPGSGEPVQGLLATARDCFKHVKDEDCHALEHETENWRNHVWQLSDGDVLRIILISHGAEEHSLIIAYHHIAMDGVSMHLFLRDLNAVYMGHKLDSSPKQYIDISVEERRTIESGQMDDRISYWTKLHWPPAETLPLFPFARVKSRPIPKTYHNVESLIDIGGELSEQIKRASQSLRITPFYFYLAALQTLFNRLLDVEDICIGVTDANRGESSLQTIGFFLNLLPLRFNVQKYVKFSDLVAKTAQHYRRAQANMGVPFDVILDKANVAREPTSTPLFQVAMNYRQGNFSKIPLGGSNLEFRDGFDSQSPYDLAFSITPNNDTTYVQVVAREDLYTREGTDILLSAYMALLHDASRDISKSLGSINLYDQAGIDKALSLGYGDVVDYEWPSTLTEKVDEAIKRNPHDVAIKDGTGQLTYGELAVKVNKLASGIQSQLRPGSTVAVLCEPAACWVISMLAIIRSGCIYVPLDGKLPDERLKVIIDAVAPGLMLCEDYTKQRAHNISAGGPVLSVTDIPGPTETTNAPNLERVNETTFILFTSGSTGTPKGIRLLSRGIVNYVATKSSKLSLGREIVLQQSALGFDMSLAQAFLALALGGTLAIAPSVSRGDPLALGKLMADEGVTFTLGTPTEYLMLIRHGGQAVKTMQSWRNATSGGEAITAQLKASFRALQQPPILTDCYGPTEISCCATIKTIDLENDGDDSAYSSVGTANPNTSIYILDDSGNVVPQGLTGEIYIGGVGVALNYLDEKSTSQRFVPNSFATAEQTEKGWTTMYRTGDKGLIRADGGLQFMGRMDGDTTVKLRGLRVDLDGVASVMLQQFKGYLEDVVVTVRGDPAFLVAYVVLTSGTSMDASRLQELACTLPLPQYMRPAMVIQLERLPLNSSGKVDRRAIAALPLPTWPSSPGPAKATSDRKPTLIEGELRLIWHNVLSQAGLANTARLEPDTDFFHVGGNSLLLVRLRSAIEISMGITLPLSDMYRSSTLAGMADLVAHQKSSDYAPEVIDWDAETALPQSIALSYSYNTTPVRTESGLEVLMTGSTSFLGKQILQSLLNRPSVARIHCIAVDSDSEASHLKDDRVTVYPGSLSEPMLGLKRETYQRLQATVDTIILAGSQGHCLNNYSTLLTPNVESTRQMGLFALGRRIPVHYISSNRVTLLGSSAEATLPPVTVRDHQPPTDGSEGFTAAKWAGEVFLEKLSRATAANAERDLPVTIHRHCAIVGDEAPIEDALNALLRYSKLINAVPRVSSLNVGGYFDFLPVTDVADSFAEFVLSSQGTHSGVAFKHYSSGVKVPPTDFASYMQKKYGDEFRELDLDDWIEEARREGIEELIVLYLQAIVEKGQRITFPFMGNTV